jgi:enoyl-CoA hydratase
MRIERRGEVAIVFVEGGKANAMSPELLGRLAALVGEVEASDARAMVLTGYDRYFSAGLALPILIDLDRAAMRGFMDAFDRAMLRVYACPLPVVASVNGHAIAGGCVLAMQCDARLMADGDFKIGLSEAQLGIGLPATVVEPLRALVPASSLSPIALEGRLLSPKDAVGLGLVDRVVAKDELLSRAVERATELARTPPSAYRQLKSSLRRPVIEAIERSAESCRESWLDTWFSADAQERLRSAVAKIS